MLPNFSILGSPEKCAYLNCLFQGKDVVAVYASANPRQNADVLLELCSRLKEKRVETMVFYNSSAREIIKALSSKYQIICFELDAWPLFSFLKFIKILVTSDYCADFYEAKFADSVIIVLPHHSRSGLGAYNFYFDYIISCNINQNVSFTWPNCNFSALPNYTKIHKNRRLGVIYCGPPKLDLLIESRKSYVQNQSQPIMLCYPNRLDSIRIVSNLPDEEIKKQIVELAMNFIAKFPSGLFVFRPYTKDTNDILFAEIIKDIGDNTSFIVDTNLDQTIWLSKADYFVVIDSTSDSNFSLSSLKPSIKFNISDDKKYGIYKYDLGYVINSACKLNSAVDLIQETEPFWRSSILELRNKTYPNSDHCFEILTGAIIDILSNKENLFIRYIDKGDTVCDNVAEYIKCLRALWEPHFANADNGWSFFTSWLNSNYARVLPFFYDIQVQKYLLKLIVANYKREIFFKEEIATFLRVLYYNIEISFKYAWSLVLSSNLENPALLSTGFLILLASCEKAEKKEKIVARKAMKKISPQNVAQFFETARSVFGDFFNPEYLKGD